MRGSGIKYAIEHTDPELGQAIWDELMTPNPSAHEIREEKAREIEANALNAKAIYKTETLTNRLLDIDGITKETAASVLDFVKMDLARVGLLEKFLDDHPHALSTEILNFISKQEAIGKEEATLSDCVDLLDGAETLDALCKDGCKNPMTEEKIEAFIAKVREADRL